MNGKIQVYLYLTVVILSLLAGIDSYVSISSFIAFPILRRPFTRENSPQLTLYSNRNKAYTKGDSSGDSRRQSGKQPRQKRAVSPRKSDVQYGRVARLLRDELSEIIYQCGSLNEHARSEDYLSGSVSITEVELNGDLSLAKVYVSVIGTSTERQQMFVWLCENIREIRYTLSQRLNSMRKIPLVVFNLVDSSQTSFFITDGMGDVANQARAKLSSLEGSELKGEDNEINMEEDQEEFDGFVFQ